MKMKVLHILSGFDGGIPSFVRNIALAIDHTKYSFDVISFTDYPPEFIEDIAVTDGVCLTMPRPKVVGYPEFFRKTQAIIEKHGPYDVIECHLTGIYASVFKYITRNQTHRFVIHAHAADDDAADTFSNRFKRSLNRKLSVMTADQLTSCSKIASKFMYGSKVVDNQQVVHIPNGIAVEKFTTTLTPIEINRLKKEHNIPTNVAVLGNIGRFDYQKNHPFMVDLIDHLAKNKVEFIWLFVGSGRDEETIKEMIAKKGLNHYVRFLGRREDVHLFYQLLDVFVLPSFYEGLPTVVVESQAAGVNTVLTDTITPEVDLGLGMLEYLSLNADLEKWEAALKKALQKKVPDVKTRIKHIEANGFTHQAASQLYEQFLDGKIQHFEIGQSIKNGAG